MDGQGDSLLPGTCPSQPQFRFVANPNAVTTDSGPVPDARDPIWVANYMFQTNQGPKFFPPSVYLWRHISSQCKRDDHMGIFASETEEGYGSQTRGMYCGCHDQSRIDSSES